MLTALPFDVALPTTFPVLVLTVHTAPFVARIRTRVLAFTLAAEVGEPAAGAGARMRTAPAFFTNLRVIFSSVEKARTPDDIERTELEAAHLEGFALQYVVSAVWVQGVTPNAVQTAWRSDTDPEGGVSVGALALLGEEGMVNS